MIKPLRLISLSLMLSALASCSSFKGDPSCLVFKPITFSELDTQETKEQIVEHDTKWLRVCQK